MAQFFYGTPPQETSQSNLHSSTSRKRPNLHKERKEIELCEL